MSHLTRLGCNRRCVLLDHVIQAVDEFFSKLSSQKIDIKLHQQVFNILINTKAEPYMHSNNTTAV